ncbi:hypothetical protein E2C01_011089 [Portunus trituberculatus]|uniref:Uncharacterized protein n=1 Tax=Portunus trituberculatus TaxID=210409 RepID=A0A5B7DA67_PORTR|nr:hypothetical protein [Portunus trituberculatus]
MLTRRRHNIPPPCTTTQNSNSNTWYIAANRKWVQRGLATRSRERFIRDDKTKSNVDKYVVRKRNTVERKGESGGRWCSHKVLPELSQRFPNHGYRL